LNWDQARQLLRLGRSRRSGSSDSSVVDVGPEPPALARFAVAHGERARPRAQQVASSVCVASGKGGTGKTLVVAALARELAAHARTLLLDADLGCANAHLLHDVHPERSLIDVVEGRLAVREIVTECGGNLALLPGGSGFARLAGLTDFELHVVARGLEELEPSFRYLCVDSAAGLSNQTVAFAAACDLVLLVTTPDVTAMTDAYAFLKVFVRQNPRAMPLLVVNRCTEQGEAEHVARRVSDVTRKFLGRDLVCLAALPEDRAAFRCTQRRMPVTVGEPHSPLAAALRALTRSVQEALASVPAQGAGATLVRKIGYGGGPER
jgi:flagellar biosynthesis protein FlhG